MATWLIYFAGPLLGLFLIGMTTRRPTESDALVGVGCGALVVGLLFWNRDALPFHKLWIGPFSLAVTYVVGGVLAPLVPPARNERSDDEPDEDRDRKHPVEM
jgi:hypothetical protein